MNCVNIKACIGVLMTIENKRPKTKPVNDDMKMNPVAMDTELSVRVVRRKKFV
jgi:hypothetical protein